MGMKPNTHENDHFQFGTHIFMGVLHCAKSAWIEKLMWEVISHWKWQEKMVRILIPNRHG